MTKLYIAGVFIVLFLSLVSADPYSDCTVYGNCISVTSMSTSSSSNSSSSSSPWTRTNPFTYLLNILDFVGIGTATPDAQLEVVTEGTFIDGGYGMVPADSFITASEDINSPQSYRGGDNVTFWVYGIYNQGAGNPFYTINNNFTSINITATFSSVQLDWGVAEGTPSGYLLIRNLNGVNYSQNFNDSTFSILDGGSGWNSTVPDVSITSVTQENVTRLNYNDGSNFWGIWTNRKSFFGQNITMNSSRVTNMSNPVMGSDAATKNYVDTYTSSYSIMAGHAGFNPADNTTYYFGSRYSTVATTSANNAPLVIPKNGTLNSIYIVYRGTAGTAENFTYNLVINNTSTKLITATANLNSTGGIIFNGTINAPIVAGDTIELSMVTPSWAANPTSIFESATLYIGPTVSV